MIKDNIKNENAITLITLVVTVLVLVIITATLAKNTYDSTQLSNLTKLDNDIEVLNDRIAAYYVEYGELPMYGEKTYYKSDLKSSISDLSLNDGNEYYIIDLSKLDNITLNYGGDYLVTSSENLYIINAESHIIYYLKGVKYKGETYHTTGSNLSITLNY